VSQNVKKILQKKKTNMWVIKLSLRERNSRKPVSEMTLIFCSVFSYSLQGRKAFVTAKSLPFVKEQLSMKKKKSNNTMSHGNKTILTFM